MGNFYEQIILRKNERERHLIMCDNNVLTKISSTDRI